MAGQSIESPIHVVGVVKRRVFAGPSTGARRVWSFGVFLLGPLLALVLPAEAAAAPRARVGLVVMSRVLGESAQAKAAFEALVKTLKDKQANVESEQAAIQALRMDLERSAATLSEVEKQARAKEILDRSQAVERTVAETRNAVAEADSAITSRLMGRVKEVVAGLAESRDLDVVLQVSVEGVLFAREGCDLTDEVIRQVNLQ